MNEETILILKCAITYLLMVLSAANVSHIEKQHVKLLEERDTYSLIFRFYQLMTTAIATAVTIVLWNV